ncbi:hypothetical protein WJX84_005030 [Apatococcus fuscideae]|uniref:Membrane transporter protein n=1 Tax=Apatococcus fuscideae TaxID=2026836 RepID=A0AAW1T7Q9_9CHLO
MTHLFRYHLIFSSYLPVVQRLTAPRELHKFLFPLSARDLIGFACAIIALFVAAGGGVGGGGVLVPVYILVFEFSTGAAVGLSNITILGGAISNLLFNAPRRHTLKDAPLIDWDLIMVMEPVTILGTILGGYLNKLSPGWLTTFLLALLMTFMTWKLASRGIATWRAETKQHQQADVPPVEASAGDVAPADLSQPLLSSDPTDSAINPSALPPTPPADMTLASLLRQSYTRSLTLTEGLEHIHPVEGHEMGSPRSKRSRKADGACLLGDQPTRTSSPSPYEPAAPTADNVARISGNQPSRPSPLRPARLEDARSAISAPAAEPIPKHGPTDSSHGHAEGDSPREPGDATHDEEAVGLNGEHVGEGSHEQSASERPSFSQRHLGTWLHKGSWTGKDPEGGQAELDSIRRGESTQIPVFKVAILLAMFAGVLASDTTKTRLQCGTCTYWVVVLSVVPFILVLAAGVRAYLLRKFHVKARYGWEWTEGDVQWNEQATIIYPAVCSLAGLVAGLFGIGGGVIKGPLMLEMNVLPDVAAATSATMILFTSLVGSLVFISFGAIDVDYGVAVFTVGLVSTLFGQFACYRLMQILKRRSIPIFAMTGLMAMAMVGVWVQTSISTWDAARSGHILDTGTICGRPGQH